VVWIRKGPDARRRRPPSGPHQEAASADSSSTWSCVNKPGAREEPGTLTQGVTLFALVPLDWESNPKLQGGWCLCSVMGDDVVYL
jgi:hypothetical protein